MKTVLYWTCASSAVLLATLCFAGSAATAAVTDEIQLLREENARMRDPLGKQEERLAALEARESPRKASVDRGPTIEGGEGLEAVVSGVPIRLTGFLKGDMLWNSSRVDSTSAPRLSDVGRMGSDDQFTATVQHSRISAIVGPVPLGDSTLGGTVEMDLFNLSDSGPRTSTTTSCACASSSWRSRTATGRCSLGTSSLR